MEYKTILTSRYDPNWKYYVPKEEHEMVAIKGSKTGMQFVNGHYIPNLCRNLSVIKKMDVRPDDTFVVTYPKSGTNWVAGIIWLIQNNCDFERCEKEAHFMRTTFIDMGWSNDFLNLTPSPRVFKSHLRHCFLPDNLENRAKVIYVIRNPKDVLVSMFHFLKTTPEDVFDGTFEELYDAYVKGKFMYDSFWEHINEYTKINNIHIVHFEDLLEDGLNETRKIAKFLGKDLSDDRLKAIVDFCSFDSLKKKKIFEFTKPDDNETNKTGSEEQNDIKHNQVKLLRKGQIGDWKNYFTEKMSKTIDDIVATKVDYKKPFKYEPTNMSENSA